MLEQDREAYRQALAALTVEGDEDRQATLEALRDHNTDLSRHLLQVLRLRMVQGGSADSLRALDLPARPPEIPYEPRHDPLVQAKYDELQQCADLAYWQLTRSERRSARGLTPHQSLAEQAYVMAKAARWSLLAFPPKSLKWSVYWKLEGERLDPDSEQLLLQRSYKKRNDAWWRAGLRKT
jgi:hypothetical protein